MTFFPKEVRNTSVLSVAITVLVACILTFLLAVYTNVKFGYDFPDLYSALLVFVGIFDFLTDYILLAQLFSTAHRYRYYVMAIMMISYFASLAFLLRWRLFIGPKIDVVNN